MDCRPHDPDETMENQSPFDLNVAIQRWRDQLAHSPSFRADDLEELESHIRDSERSLRALGLTEEEAFLIAIRRIGAGEALAAEFAAVNGSPAWLDRLLWITTGSMTIYAGWSLMSTLLLSRPFSLSAEILLLFALFLALAWKFLRTLSRAPLRLPSGLLLVGLFCVLLRNAFVANRMLGPIASFPYIQRLFLFNLTFFVQWVASASVIAFAGFKRPKPRPQ
jgi:hypothetical protein